jgi:hypothetical protein
MPVKVAYNRSIFISRLDDSLAKTDRLTILKTRARYTLKCLEQSATAACLPKTTLRDR